MRAARYGNRPAVIPAPGERCVDVKARCEAAGAVLCFEGQRLYLVQLPGQPAEPHTAEALAGVLPLPWPPVRGACPRRTALADD